MLAASSPWYAQQNKVMRLLIRCASVVLLTASHSSIPLCVCSQTLRNFEGFRAAGAARPAQLVTARSRQVRCRPGCPCQRARAHSSVQGACTQRPRLGCGALQAEADWQQGFTALCQLGTGLCWCVAVVPELECAVSAHGHAPHGSVCETCVTCSCRRRHSELP